MTATGLQDLGAGPLDTATTAGPRRRFKLWPWIAVAAILVVAVVVRHNRASSTAAAGRGREGPRAVPVVTAPARTGDVPVYLRGLGTAAALKTATVKSRVDGQLVSVAFREGQYVTEGQVLAQIDPRPFQVQIEQAEGQLARDKAALRDAQVNLERNQALFEQQILPRQQLDTQAAQVGQLDGAIKADEAQVHNARLQLSYSRITAPFTGRIGLRLLDPGNVVHASDPTGLLVVTQVHPIAVVFSLPQDDLGQVLAKLRSGGTLVVDAFDRDNTRSIAKGTLLGIDNQIDAATGTYKLKATFDNLDDALFPNQFVNVRLHLDTLRGLTLFPTAALQRGQDGTFVYVVGPDLLAKVRPVTVALTEGSDTAVQTGLQAGENVVVDGQDKLREGSKVDLGTRAAGGDGQNAPGARAGKGQAGSRGKAPAQ